MRWFLFLIWLGLGIAVPAVAAVQVAPSSTPQVEAERAKRQALERLADCMVSRERRKIESILLADPRSGAFEKWAEGHSTKCYTQVLKSVGFDIRPDGTTLQYALAEAVFRRMPRISEPMRFPDAFVTKGSLPQGIAKYALPVGVRRSPEELEKLGIRQQRAHFMSVLAECVLRAYPDATYHLLRSEAWSAAEDRAFSLLTPNISACVDNRNPISIDREGLRGALAVNYLRLMSEPEDLTPLLHGSR